MICQRRPARHLYAHTPQGLIPIATYGTRRELVEQAEYALEQGFQLTERSLNRVALAVERLAADPRQET